MNKMIKTRQLCWIIKRNKKKNNEIVGVKLCHLKKIDPNRDFKFGNIRSPSGNLWPILMVNLILTLKDSVDFSKIQIFLCRPI